MNVERNPDSAGWTRREMLGIAAGCSLMFGLSATAATTARIMDEYSQTGVMPAYSGPLSLVPVTLARNAIDLGNEPLMVLPDDVLSTDR